jgi:hypothetical protein
MRLARLDLGKMPGHKTADVAVRIVPMRSVSKVWPTRLLAAVAVLALVLASVIGTYAHAAGHSQPHTTVAADAVHADDHAGHHHGPMTKAPAIGLGHLGGNHDGDGTGHSPLDGSCDIFCHGGQAILASYALPLPLLHSVPMMQPADAFHGAQPGGLDRPPKVVRSA